MLHHSSMGGEMNSLTIWELGLSNSKNIADRLIFVHGQRVAKTAL